MAKKRPIQEKMLLLSQEQTILSRERNMQAYISTGLAFIGVGLVVLRLFEGMLYWVLGGVFLLIGFWQILEAYERFRKYRKVARQIRRKEKALRLEVGE